MNGPNKLERAIYNGLEELAWDKQANILAYRAHTSYEENGVL
jgi:hypothetical protein